MKRYLCMILVLIIAVGIFTGCGGNGGDAKSGNQNNNDSQKSSSDYKVTDSYLIIFKFSRRAELAGVDAAPYQLSFDLDMTWNGLDFEAASVFSREVGGRYEVQEDVVIKGRISADEKNIESLTLRNERTGDIYEMLELEIENIPYMSDHSYTDMFFKFYMREDADSLAEHIKTWNVQAVKDGEIKDIEAQFEYLERLEELGEKSEMEIEISFRYN